VHPASEDDVDGIVSDGRSPTRAVVNRRMEARIGRLTADEMSRVDETLAITLDLSM
jgi:mRNA-degrading endonuclease toxin of MazEF toxin-antitoxin module